MAAGNPGARKRRRRLSRSAEFDRVYREGRSHSNRFLVVYAFPRGAEEQPADSRLGVSVGRKLGGAAQRNSVKRALREAFWGLDPLPPDGHDFVLVGREPLAGLLEREGGDGVRRCLAEVLEEAGLSEGHFT